MTTAARRATKKAKSRTAHTHILGERCQVCRPSPQEQSADQSWRPSAITLDHMLAAQVQALKGRSQAVLPMRSRGGKVRRRSFRRRAG